MKSESSHPAASGQGVDSYKDSKANFFRQSGWMMAANMACGVFMAASQFLLPKLTPGSDFSVALTIFRIFVLLSLPASAIQTILAQQMAAAIDEEARRDASATARGVLKLTFLFWVALTVIAAAFRKEIADVLQASSPNLVWVVLILILGSLTLPIFLGLLQGMQMFMPFGWATIVNGVGRFIAILIGIRVFQVGAMGATWGAFAGFAIASVIAAWPSRIVFQTAPGHFDTAKFLKNVMLLTAAAGSTLFIINVDMPLIQAHFPKEISTYYGGAETIGIAVVILCVPVAAVMFPKIVRSRATATTSDALRLAVTGTALIAGATAIFCTFFPEVPLRILYFKNPDMVQSAPLIRWFMWAMVPLTIYNVLVNNLIARERYGIVPFAAILPMAYAVTLYFFLERSHQPPFVTFQRVIQILLLFNTTLMLISVYFSRRVAAGDAAAGHSQPKAAKPS
jgi:O-antigen/teichoic acid export membrane protein